MPKEPVAACAAEESRVEGHGGDPEELVQRPPRVRLHGGDILRQEEDGPLLRGRREVGAEGEEVPRHGSAGSEEPSLKALLREILAGEAAHDEEGMSRTVMGCEALHPGRRGCRDVVEDDRGGEPAAQEVPQPRVHFQEVVRGGEAEADISERMSPRAEAGERFELHQL